MRSRPKSTPTTVAPLRATLLDVQPVPVPRSRIQTQDAVFDRVGDVAADFIVVRAARIPYIGSALVIGLNRSIHWIFRGSGAANPSYTSAACCRERCGAATPLAPGLHRRSRHRNRTATDPHAQERCSDIGR